MAKIKLNIKNAQLAEALKLGGERPEEQKPEKKSAAPKAPPPPEPEAVETVTPPPPPPVQEEAAAPPPPPAPPPAPVAEAPAAPPPPRAEESPPPPPAPPKPKIGSVRPPLAARPAGQYRTPPPIKSAQGERRFITLPPRKPSGPPYRSGAAGERPRTGAPGARPYSPRPPYTPRPGGRPGLGGRPPLGRPLPPSTEPSRRGPDDKTKKAVSFKEYRDIKPLKKPDGRRSSFDSRDRQGLRDLDDEAWRKRRSLKDRGMEDGEEILRPKELAVRIPITIKELASAMKLKASQIISHLLRQGMPMTLNDLLDDETMIQLIGDQFDCKIAIDRSEEERLRITDKSIREEIQESSPEQLQLRPPVATFMGHVDHGKTTLIDAIRKSDLAAGEAGAITQHIGAFKCHTAVGDLTILDTPGHEAFSAMRERGADVTDIVVLVVAGDEGIRAQTLEAISQAKKAKVSLVVAVNKADKPDFNAENVYRQLSEQELLPEVWGGQTITVNCSATTGQGIPQLLEMLAIQAEVLELKANPESRARGTVIESELHKGLGPVATVLVQNGTLRLGDALVVDHYWGRIKSMQDEHGKQLREAGPSTPVKIAGLSGVPEAGSEFIVFGSEREARELAEEREVGHRKTMTQQLKPKASELMKGMEAPKKVLPLILRGDVQGSVEALKSSLQKIASTKVDLLIISAGVGEISESDVELAAASEAPIIGFHTNAAPQIEELLKQTGVVIKTFDIIYHAVDAVKELMRGLLDKIPQETETGTVLVKALFRSSQLGTIAGCVVTEGTVKRSNHVRVIREGKQIWKGRISSLRRVKEDVREVSKGVECGVLLHGFSELQENDILQAFEVTYLTPEL